MTKIAFFCIPAQGHTNPTLPVVRALAGMGCAVTYFSFEPFRGAIEAAGARFIDCGGSGAVPDAGAVPETGGGAVARDILVSTKLIVDVTLSMQDMALRELRALEPDVIVADSVAFWGKLYAERLGIPFVCSTTTFAFNRHSARIMKQSMGEALGMLLRLPRAAKLMKPLRDAGYAVKGVMDIVQNDERTPTVVYTSREFQPCAETFPDNFAFVGPCLRDIAEPMAKPERPLVYISMGTVLDGESQFYERCAEAFGDGKYEVVMSVGESRMPRGLGENLRAFKRVDQLAALRVADVFITHCGMNSASEALYYGVPLVTRPLTPEEGGVANRVEALGAGLRLGDAAPGAIRAAVDAVLKNPGYRDDARRLGEGFRACGGPEAAARFIIEAGRKRP